MSSEVDLRRAESGGGGVDALVISGWRSPGSQTVGVGPCSPFRCSIASTNAGYRNQADRATAIHLDLASDWQRLRIMVRDFALGAPAL